MMKRAFGRPAAVPLLLAIAPAAALCVACNTQDTVTAPQSPAVLESLETGVCMQSCATAAAAALVEEQKRFGTAMALSVRDAETILQEQLLHKQILREIRNTLRDCRRACVRRPPGA